MLFRKAIRAIMSNKRSYSACVFLIAMGISMYIAMNTAGEGLSTAISDFYYNYNLAHIFARVDAIPISAVEALGDIDGIEAVQARRVFEVRAETSDSDEIIMLRMVSVDTSGEVSGINRLRVLGNQLSDENDILLNPTFFNAHGLSIGDSISIFVNGREHIYNVAGTALNPEYAYVIRSASEMLPDETGFGIGYITKESAGHLTNSTGIANDIVFRLKYGYSFEDVNTMLEDALAPYGIIELIDREDQLSYAFLRMEVDSMQSMSTSFPMMFVIIAIIVLYMMLKRVIEQDRTQIGTLKAFGFSNVQIIGHYLFYGGITGLAGGILGCILGYYLSGYFLAMYLEFFTIPDMPSEAKPEYLIGGILISVIGGLAGAFMGAVKVLKLNPAESMRPESPKPIKYDLVGKITLLNYVLTSRGNMALRNISRNWVRSIFVMMGIMFSFGLLSIVGSFDNLIDKMLYSQFTDTQLYGVKINLLRPVEYTRAVENAYSIDHVTLAEGLLEIPVELVNKHIREGTILTGIDANSSLYKIHDSREGVNYSPPKDSLILSSSIARKLGVVAGDIIYIAHPLGDDDISIPISRVIEQNLGGSGYMELAALSELLEQPKTATSIILNTDNLSYLKDYLKGSGNTGAIDDKDSTLRKYQEMMEMYTSILWSLQIMGALVAFAIIYNTSTISLSERKREYATLRVLGLSVNEVCEIMNFEYWILSIIAMTLGIPFAIFLNNAMNSMMDTSLFSMPSTLPANAYLSGVVGCVAAILLSNFSAKRRIRKFDMVEVLKERE